MGSSTEMIGLTFCCTCKTKSYHGDDLQKEFGSLKASWRFWQILTWLTFCFSPSRQHMNILAVWGMFRVSFIMLSAQLNASHKSNPSSVPRGIADLYSTLRWVTWEAVTVVEGITWWGLLGHTLANRALVYRSQGGRYCAKGCMALGLR